MAKAASRTQRPAPQRPPARPAPQPSKAAHSEPDHEDQRMLHRLLFFSDAVFAIVLTLLVLELRPPEHAHDPASFWQGLTEMRPHLAAFALSFALAAIFWMAHMSTLRKLARFDWPVAVANLVFLLVVSLMPFASALLGESFSGTATWTVYCWELIAASATMLVLVLVGTRDGGRLMGGMDGRERAFRLIRAAAPGVSFGVGLVLMAAGLSGWAHLCYLLIPVIFLVARSTLGAKR